MSISRLQLAAALLEYDNDEDLASPGPIRTEFKDHRQSAIFQPFQQAKAEARRQQILSQPAPSLPSLLPAEPVASVEPPKPEEQKWRKSTLGEFNPLATGPGPSRDWPAPPGEGHREEIEGDDDEEEDLADVDVARWGLPSHLVVEEERKAKEKKKDRPESTRRSTVPHHTPQPTPSPMNHSRIKSIHMSDVLDDTALHRQVMAETQAKLEGGGDHRRALSYDRYGASQAFAESDRSRRLADRPATAMGMQNRGTPERIRTISDPMMLPLPRSPVSAFDNRPMSSLSRGWSSPPPGRMDQEEYVEDEEEQEPPNPFALPAPPPELGSRFDPKVLQHQRQPSSSSMPMTAGTDYDPRSSRMSSHMRCGEGYFDDQQQQPPHSATSSSHHRRSDERESLRSPTVVYNDIPTPEAFGRPLMAKRYSTSAKLQMDRSTLLRPKTLIMPTPLANRPPPTIREPKLPEGYTLGEKPLPYEARTMGDRPGMPMSLSQRTFRSSLMVGGTREDEFWVGGAEEEGEVGVQSRELDEGAIMRKPGKLYGKSLMDQLEARKAALKGRQRVFTGDARPAMMARSTIYEMPTVSISPTSPEQQQYQQYPSSRHSSMLPVPGQIPGEQPQGRAPLLAFDSNGELHPTSPGGLMAPPQNDRQGRIAKSKSVFGVDQIWEKEMSKLRQMQEDERRAEETRRAIEEAKKLAEEEKKKRKSKKGKGKERMTIVVPDEDTRPVEEVLGISPIKRAHELPPALEFEPEKAPSPPSPPSQPASPEKTPRFGENIDNDGLNEAEEEEGPRAEHSSPQAQQPNVIIAESGSESDSDSDADVPLSRLAPPRSAHSGGPKPLHNILGGQESESDSDEDVPLSKLSIRSPGASSNSHSNNHHHPSSAQRLTEPLGSLGLSLPTFSPSGTPSNEPGGDDNDEEDEDDQPLAVKQAKARGLKPITKADIIEDDLPLGYKHAEKAQKQMAERGSQVSWDGRNSAASFNPYESGMNMGMGMGGMGGMSGMGDMGGMGGGMGWNPHQSSMAPQQFHNPMMGMHPNPDMGMKPYPFGGGGYPSMPNMNMNMNLQPGYPHMNNPYQMGMGMGMGMGGQPPMGDIGMGTGMGMPPPMGQISSPQNPGKTIDNWRQDVALAPVPTGSGSSVGAGAGAAGGGTGRRSVVG
ncbi:hypothetical protein IAT40_006626 [Kwoniella sp. CBS 6097]